MALAPGFQRVDDGPQGFADLGEAIFHPRRHLGIDLSDDEPVALERAQLFGEHALGDAGHPAAQLAEALRARLQMKQNHALPLAIDQVKGGFHRAARPMREILAFHADFPMVSKQGLYPSIYSTCQIGASTTSVPAR